MWRYRLAVRFGVILVALSALAASAVAFGPKPKLDLIVRPVGHVHDPNVVLEVVYRAGDLRCTGLQFDIEFNNTSRVTVAAGPAAELANKTVAVGDTGGSHKRILVFGLNSDVLWDGVLAVVTVAPGETEAQDPLTIRLTSIVAVDQGVGSVALDPVEFKRRDTAFGGRLMLGRQSAGYSLASLPLFATMPCTSDVNGDGKTDLADLQLLAAMASGETTGRCDLNGDGKVTAEDFRIVLNAIQGGGRLPPQLRREQ